MALLASKSLAAARGTWGVALGQCVRHMSKYLSKAQTKRQPLNTKWAKKGYVKGKGARSTGHHTSKGKYVIDKNKLVELIVPDLHDFKLKPYVARSVRREQYPLARVALGEASSAKGGASARS
mmetsp:Transcript_1277/g.3870  ORF Transcript_1277/g.3870 Transcript_1277/m.3870 type:complete len:123 (+) Transcript_1277:147-515(+)